eukprot:scaffold996_cov409-Prasinococcus_capsulatus_cf.AAC.14
MRRHTLNSRLVQSNAPSKSCRHTFICDVVMRRSNSTACKHKAFVTHPSAKSLYGLCNLARDEEQIRHPLTGKSKR